MDKKEEKVGNRAEMKHTHAKVPILFPLKHCCIS